MRIAEDGVIDEDERESFDSIAEELTALIGAAYQVLYPAKTKKDRPEGGSSRRSAFKGLQQRSNNRTAIVAHRAEELQAKISQEGGAFL
jgi:hypothetical protein